MALAFAVTFAWLSVSRHLAYQSHAFDLGNMDQAVWNTLHGHFLRFTDMEVHGRVLQTRLAIHVEPLLALFAPLYLIHSGPETLLVLQSVVVATGAIPAYLLAARAIGNRWLALVFPLAYLLHPSLQNALLDDFHAVTLTLALLLWALYFAYTERIAPFAATAVLATACKEEVGLIVALLGVLLIFRQHLRAGIATVIGGTFWFVVCVAAIIPHFNPGGSPYLTRYRYLGHGLGGVVSGLALHPDRAVNVLTSPPRLEFLRYLLEPLGFTSLLGLPILIIAAPAAFIDMLSSDPRMYSGFYQYTAEIVPLAVGSSAIGIGWIGSLLRRRWDWSQPWVAGALCLLVVLSAAVESRQQGFTPVARGYSIPSAGAHQARENNLLGAIPANAVVAAADETEPHLSDRTWIYLLPTIHPSNGPAADYIVLDASVPSQPVTPRTLHGVAVRALNSGYGVQNADDGIVVLRKGARSHQLPPSFYRFVFNAGAPETGRTSWGPLSLLGSVVRPTDGLIDRSRPAIGVETDWITTHPLPHGVHITLYISPVYKGAHPKFSAGWKSETDSPTWDWLPLTRWPPGRPIRADLLPISPPPYTTGRVDVVIRVTGLGAVIRHATGSPPLSGFDAVRVATLTVEG